MEVQRKRRLDAKKSSAVSKAADAADAAAAAVEQKIFEEEERRLQIAKQVPSCFSKRAALVA